MKRLFLFGLLPLVFAASCPPKPPPPSGPTLRTVTVKVTHVDGGAAIQGAIVSGLIPGTTVPSNSEGWAFTLDVSSDTHVVDLRVVAVGCVTWDQHLTLPDGTIDQAHAIPARLTCAPPPAPYPFPAEVGPLHIDGDVFRTVAGAEWTFDGVDSYLGFARMLRGEDPRPTFHWARGKGFNAIRVFLQVDPDRGWPAWADFKHPEQRPEFDARLTSYVQQAVAYGLRLELTVLTYPDAVTTQRAYVQRVYDVVAPFASSVLIEIGNECDPQGINCEAAAAGVNRHGILSAYGYYDPVPAPVAGAPLTAATAFRALDAPTPFLIHAKVAATLGGQLDAIDLRRAFPTATTTLLAAPATLRMLDYVTVHTDRGAEWPRKAKDALELRGGYGSATDLYWFLGTHRPVVGDEPMGADETNQPGRRSNVASDFAAHFAIGRLFSAGTTFHFQAGLEGRIPGAGEPVQEAIAVEILRTKQRAPSQTQHCEYTRGGFDSLGIAWAEADSLRTYGVTCGGNQQHLAIARPRAGWAPVALPGWLVVTRADPWLRLSR